MYSIAQSKLDLFRGSAALSRGRWTACKTPFRAPQDQPPTYVQALAATSCAGVRAGAVPFTSVHSRVSCPRRSRDPPCFCLNASIQLMATSVLTVSSRSRGAAALRRSELRCGVVLFGSYQDPLWPLSSMSTHDCNSSPWPFPTTHHHVCRESAPYCLAPCCFRVLPGLETAKSQEDCRHSAKSSSRR